MVKASSFDILLSNLEYSGESPDVAVSISLSNDNVSLRLSLTVIMVATNIYYKLTLVYNCILYHELLTNN